MTEEKSALQKQDVQVEEQNHGLQNHDPHMNKQQHPKPRKAKIGTGQAKRRRSRRKETREWVTTAVQLTGVVAVIISLVSLAINIQQFNQQQQKADNSALDQQHQATLDTYIDHMSTLLLQYHLIQSKPDDSVRAVAQARTYAALRNIDPPRQGTLIRFLWGAGLINGSQPIISLSIVNIAHADLSYAYLQKVNLNNALLMNANFQDGDLSNADLTNANLTRATLTGTDLTGANLTNANLTGTDLTGADLTRAKLKGANLSGSILTGVTMPDGSKHS